MKKILIVLLFVSTNIFAQQTIENKHSVFKIPQDLLLVKKTNNIKTIQKEQLELKKIVRLQSFNDNEFFGEGLIKLIQYKDTMLYVKPDYIERTKGILDEMATYQGKKTAGYSSLIKTYKNKSVLIIKNEINEYISFAIFSVNNSYDKVLNSTIVILKKDSTAGNKEVEKFINSIQFK